MQKYRLTVEYDGSGYSGWQVQRNARTIQGELLAAARELLGPEAELQGAGRTDAGVHAMGQVAHLDSPQRVPTSKLLYAFNDRLPGDIHILELRPGKLDFHARHDAIGRSYLYVITTRRSAFGARYAWWVRDPLKLPLMRQAAEGFLGLRDFGRFADKRIEEGVSTKSRVEGIEIRQWGELILVRVAGDHFLWKMVRRIVGILVEVGRGNLPPTCIPELLTRDSELPAKHTAPCYGLFLEQVRYPGEALRPLTVPAFPVGRLWLGEDEKTPPTD